MEEDFIYVDKKIEEQSLSMKIKIKLFNSTNGMSNIKRKAQIKNFLLIIKLK